ncbi:MAG: hypothetical protein AAFS13_07505 [Pseudomonadota bacterium]
MSDPRSDLSMALYIALKLAPRRLKSLYADKRPHLSDEGAGTLADRMEAALQGYEIKRKPGRGAAPTTPGTASRNQK